MKDMLRHEGLFIPVMEECVPSYGFKPTSGGRRRCVLATSATVQHLSSVKSYEGYFEI